MTNAEVLAAYRTNHKIHLEATDTPHEYRCSVDGLRVIPLIRGDRWRHHPDDIVKVLDAEYGGPWGSPKAAAVSRIIEVVDAHEDDDEFDREGAPEFSGQFR